MILLTGLCVALGWRPDPVGMAAAVLGFSLIAVLGTALALVFSAANVFFRDFSNVVQTLTQFTTFSVPMIYPYSMVSDKFGEYAQLLPAQSHAPRRSCCSSAASGWAPPTTPRTTIATNMPDNLFEIGFAHLGVALVLLGLAQLVFTRLENKIPERL